MIDSNIPRQAYTIREFAAAYSVPVRTLYRLWSRGDGPERTRIGERKVLITRAAGDRWLADNAEDLAA